MFEKGYVTLASGGLADFTEHDVLGLWEQLCVISLGLNSSAPQCTLEGVRAQIWETPSQQQDGSAFICLIEL